MTDLRAVLFDVDFTLAKPGPLLGGPGYREAAGRYGLDLEAERYPEARAAAILDIERHPELDHDEEVWVLFTEQIIRGMGGDSDRAYECAFTEEDIQQLNATTIEDLSRNVAGLNVQNLGLCFKCARAGKLVR